MENFQPPNEAGRGEDIDTLKVADKDEHINPQNSSQIRIIHWHPEKKPVENKVSVPCKPLSEDEWIKPVCGGWMN